MLPTVIAIILAAAPQGANHASASREQAQNGQYSRGNREVADRNQGANERPNLYDYNEWEVRGELRREAYYRNQECCDDSCNTNNNCNTCKPAIWPRQLRDPGDD